MAKIKKTNAMRIVEQYKLNYHVYDYENKDGNIDGISVASKINKPLDQVYKTLVAQGTSKSYYVFVIPVAAELDLKKAAALAGEKKIDLIPVKDIRQVTGYIRGGCSPIGMKKEFKTFLSHESEDQDHLVFSAGKIGMQLELTPSELVMVTKACVGDITHK